MDVAERRRQEVISSLASMAEHNHRQEVAQLTGEAARALEEQACRHVIETDRLRREAAAHHDELTPYISAKQASESKQTSVVHA